MSFRPMPIPARRPARPRASPAPPPPGRRINPVDRLPMPGPKEDGWWLMKFFVVLWLVTWFLGA